MRVPIWTSYRCHLFFKTHFKKVSKSGPGGLHVGHTVISKKCFVAHIVHHPESPVWLLVAISSKAKSQMWAGWPASFETGWPVEEPGPVTTFPDSEASKVCPGHIPENFLPKLGCTIQLTTEHRGEAVPPADQPRLCSRRSPTGGEVCLVSVAP